MKRKILLVLALSSVCAFFVVLTALLSSVLGYEKVMLDIHKPTAEMMIVRGEMQDVSSLIAPAAMYGWIQGTSREFGSATAVDGAVCRSNGVGATITTHGNYSISEIPGRWTIRCTHRDYHSIVFSVTVRQFETTHRNLSWRCNDGDGDGVCDYEDNCRSAYNGGDRGTCVCGDLTTNGQYCESDRDCVTCETPQGFCSKGQEDCDDDGQGDACSDACLESEVECCYWCWW